MTTPVNVNSPAHEGPPPLLPTKFSLTSEFSSLKNAFVDW